MARRCTALHGVARRGVARRRSDACYKNLADTQTPDASVPPVSRPSASWTPSEELHAPPPLLRTLPPEAPAALDEGKIFHPAPAGACESEDAHATSHQAVRALCLMPRWRRGPGMQLFSQRAQVEQVKTACKVDSILESGDADCVPACIQALEMYGLRGMDGRGIHRACASQPAAIMQV